ncbi:MAG: hypothetical protein ACKOEZ_07685, partial [Spartobacteria bacterium]
MPDSIATPHAAKRGPSKLIVRRAIQEKESLAGREKPDACQPAHWSNIPPILVEHPPVRPWILFSGKGAALVVLLAAVCALVFSGFPRWTADTHSMRPRESVAYPTLDRLGKALGSDQEVLHVITAGASEDEVAQKLAVARASLSEARAQGLITGFELPDSLWPHRLALESNLTSAHSVISQKQALLGVLSDAGFSEAGGFLTSGILDQWASWQASGFSLPASDS